MQVEHFFRMIDSHSEMQPEVVNQEEEGEDNDQSCPPDHAACPHSTCCGIGGDSVCCPDARTCCPAGAECDVENGSCSLKAEPGRRRRQFSAVVR